MKDISDRVETSSIPSPVGLYGVYKRPQGSRKAVYDGQTLHRFLFVNGGDPREWRNFLELNKIGRVFDLEPGRQVTIPDRDS